jgi:hemerythrin-like domain-containing protein
MSELPSPAPGFDDPLGLLAACHERIQTHCKLLGRIVEHHAHGELGPAVHGACAQVTRYFTTAAVHHHEDEEHDLFPMLLQTRPELDALVTRLRDEHDRLEALWESLAPAMAKPEDVETADLAARVASFRAAYENHIALENTELLPAARERLGEDDIARLGKAMANRRGVPL